MDNKTIYYRPLPPKPATLLIIERGKQLRIVSLSGSMSIGRESPVVYNDITLKSGIVSKNHGEFIYEDSDGSYYYRDNNSREIDLLIIYDNTIYPIEIKKSSNPTKQAIKNFDVVEKFGMNIGNGGVICMAKDLFPIDRNNNLIPIELL